MLAGPFMLDVQIEFTHLLVQINRCHTVVNKLFRVSMANLTVSLDKATVRSARIRAMREGTSLVQWWGSF